MLRSRVDKNVFIKDEGANSTGSFKARGLCAAVTMARAYGLKKLAIPSAAMRPARWLPTALPPISRRTFFMPNDVPMANRVECEAYGAGHVGVR